MKHPCKKIILSIFCIIYTMVTFAQVKEPKLRVDLMEDKDLRLYKGIVNDINIAVLEVAHPCDSTRIRISIPNGEVEHVRGDHFKIIINTNPSIATLYVESANGLVKAATMRFEAVELPDTTDGNFRSVVVQIKYHVDKNENFDPGKTNIPDQSNRYFLPTWRAPLFYLYNNAENNVWVQVNQLIDENSYCPLSPNTSLESADATISKTPGKRNTFVVTPKPGLKKCTVNVFINDQGKKTLVHTASLGVRKKPKDY